MEQEINFGLKIRDLMTQKGDTFELASKRLKANKSTIHRWTNQIDVGTDVLKKVCRGYGVSMSYFFSEPKSYIQKHNTINAAVNAVGEKIIGYGNKQENEGITTKQESDYKLLSEKLKSCEEKNALLEKMIDILERK